MDEIGFMEGQGRLELVITKLLERNESIRSSFSWSLIIILECISIDGSVLPPYILLGGKTYLEDWHTYLDLPDS